MIPTTQRMQHRHMHGVLRAEGRKREGDEDGEEERKGGREGCSGREEETKGAKWGRVGARDRDTSACICGPISLSLSPSLPPCSDPMHLHGSPSTCSRVSLGVCGQEHTHTHTHKQMHTHTHTHMHDCTHADTQAQTQTDSYPPPHTQAHAHAAD